MPEKYDAIIVGARCAGASTALLLARAGARVLVIDRGAYGTDTLSTHALMRGGVLQLHRWGVLPEIVAAGTPPIRTTSFHYSSHDVTVDIDSRLGVDALYAPRRWLLDRVLVDAARVSGATVNYGTQFVDVTRDPSGRVNGIVFRADGRCEQAHADLVIGADGLYSAVAAQVGARYTRRGRHATAVLYSYWPAAGLDGYQWFYGPGLSVGAIPTNDARCVFVSFPAHRWPELGAGDARGAYHRLLERAAPEFYRSLGDARHATAVRGFAGHAAFFRKCHGPGWALVGDAGYFKDPLTAHGITDALRDAELLARAACEGSPAAFARYEAGRDDLSEPLFEVTDRIASFSWNDEELQQLHRSLSAAMAREGKMLAQLEPLTWTFESVNVPHAV
jgi:2-polyprenyl-6-methoxyphenol hydroxylase-like FAD-dependent oxidoreductase